MATIVQDSAHFVPWQRIPTVPESDKLRNALETLHLRKVGGFVVIRGSGNVFVNGRELAVATLTIGQESVPDSTSSMGGAAYAIQPAPGAAWEALLNQPIGTFLEKLMPRIDFAGKPTVVTLETGQGDEAAEPYLNDGSRRAVVVKDGVRTLGIFFNHEDFVAVFNSNPPVWVCTVGHCNTDPDHGNCAFCFRKIVKVE